MGQFLPVGVPDVTVRRDAGAYLCDYLFLSTVRLIQPSPKAPTHLVLDRYGDVVWYYLGDENMYDFKVNGAGYLSYYADSGFYFLDSTFQVVGQARCVDRVTDFHEAHVTPDRRIFLLCTSDSIMDLSAYTTTQGDPGSSTAKVSVEMVQELTFAGNLVREWDPWPHFGIDEVANVYFTTPSRLGLTHTNSIDVDGQNRVLLSHRSLDALTIIDWNTGEITDQIGGEESDYIFAVGSEFKAQHDARFLGGNLISLFDNGQFNQPALSRGMVISYDTASTVVMTQRSYEDANVVSTSMGSFQVLPGNRGLVNLGTFVPLLRPHLQFIDGGGDVYADVTLEPTYYTYRAYCQSFPWALKRPRIVCAEQGGDLVLSTLEPAGSYAWSTGETGASIVVGDTGRYQVFVPGGMGMMGSEVLEVEVMGTGCPVVGVGDGMVGGPRARKLVGRYDLWGRAVGEVNNGGRVLVELYDDGSTRRVFRP